MDYVLPFLRSPIGMSALFEHLSRLKMLAQRRPVVVGIEFQGLAGCLFGGGRIAAASLGLGHQIEQIGRFGDRRATRAFPRGVWQANPFEQSTNATVRPIRPVFRDGA